MPEEAQREQREAQSSRDDIRELFDDFNHDPDDELPPLELIEESDIGRIEEHTQDENLPDQNGQNGDVTSSRPPRQLRNRNVARSVKNSKSVRFYDVVDCVEQNHCYQESVHLDKEGTLFPPFQSRDDIELLSQKSGNFV